MKADFANLKRYASANAKLEPDSSRIVFFGDSITEFWTSRHSPLFRHPNIVNRGTSGQTTAQMLWRFEQDVINLQPKAVVILAGINDIAQNNGPVSVEAIFGNIRDMALLAQKKGIEVVLCSVLPSNIIFWRSHIRPADDIVALNAMLASHARSNRIIFVDYYSAMADEAKGIDSMFSNDGLHPNEKGYQVMEAIVAPVVQDLL